MPFNVKLKFMFEKETPGTIRFQEVGDDEKPSFAPVSKSLYIQKSAFPGGKVPQKLTVTITER